MFPVPRKTSHDSISTFPGHVWLPGLCRVDAPALCPECPGQREIGRPKFELLHLSGKEEGGIT